MSLPACTIEQLKAQFRMKQDDWLEACREIDRLERLTEQQVETIKALELAVATLRRRVESLEGVVNP